MKQEGDIGVTILLFIFHIAAFGFIGVIILETDWESYYSIIKCIVVSVAILLGGIININKLLKRAKKEKR